MKRIIWGLAILIIPAFVLWGAGTGSKKDKGPNYAGKIFNRKVSLEEYADMWRLTRNDAMETFGNNVPPEFIDQITWNRIILLAEAKRENIVIKDTDVLERIMSFPVFQREGRFDKKLYKSMLRDGAKRFEEKLRDDMRIFKLREKITGGVSLSDEEAKEVYKENFEKIKSSYVSIPFSEFEKDVSYKETNLVKFYEVNKPSFRKPEVINLKYVQTPDEELAYKILDASGDKKDLDKIARSFELETKETNFFSMQDEIPGIGWSYEFMKRGFELGPGEISKTIIKAGENFYIIQLKEKKSSYIPEFEEAKKDAIESYIKNEAVRLSEKKAKKLYLRIINKISSGSSFEDASAQIGLEVTKTDFTTRSGYIPGLGTAMEFVETSLSLKDNEVARPIKMLESWAILKLDEYQGIDEAKFTEEKEGFKENLLLKKKEGLFDKWFEILKKEAKFVSYTLE